MNYMRDTRSGFIVDQAVAIANILFKEWDDRKFPRDVATFERWSSRLQLELEEELEGTIGEISKAPVLGKIGVRKSGEPAKDVGDNCWLLDLLDAQRLFRVGSPEFSVNIAEITNGVPTLGVVVNVVGRSVYFTSFNPDTFSNEAFKARYTGDQVHTPRKIRVVPQNIPICFTSHLRPHSPETVLRLKRLGDYTEKPLGSSLKFCELAENNGIYWALNYPTMKADVAPGQAILEAAGGWVVDEHGDRIRYEGFDKKGGLMSVPFIACGSDMRSLVLDTFGQKAA